VSYRSSIRRICIKLAILAATCFLLAQPARADVANTHQAQKDAAYAAFELGKYGEAITQFEHAYRLKRDPRLLYNIALAYFRRYELYRRAPDLQQARNLFRRFLLLVPLPEARSPKREQVRKARQFSQSYLTRIEEVLAKAKEHSAAARIAPPILQNRQPTSGAWRSKAKAQYGTGQNGTGAYRAIALALGLLRVSRSHRRCRSDHRRACAA
jgi:tetratricopeptide (TPR) repeat protein